MVKICTNCAKEMGADAAFCPECGTKAPDDTVTDAMPEISVEQSRVGCKDQATEPKSKVVSTGAYFGLMLLFALPIIGFIVCIIMAFAPKNKNIKHFARAQLIWMIVFVILVGITVALLSVLANAILDFIKESTDGAFSDWGDIFSNFGDLEGFELGEVEGSTAE